MPAPQSAVLVIQPAFLGDVILTTPLLTRLASKYGPVDVLVRPGADALLKAHPAVRQVVIFDKRGADAGVAGLRRIANEVRGTRYRRAYLPHRSLRSAALALLAGIPERIGFRGGPAAWSYTRRVPCPEQAHEVDRLLALEPDGDPPPVSIGIAEPDRRAARAWLAERNIPPGFVALAPGSVWATKRWPGYAELARRLDRPVVVLGGVEEAEEGARIAAAAVRGASAAGALTLPASTALLEQADVLVTNDSAPLHMGGATGVPIVAIFGPTVPAFGFGPRGPRDVVVEVAELSCRPCSRHGPMICPLGHHRCMRDIGVERVAEEVGRRGRGLEGQRVGGLEG